MYRVVLGQGQPCEVWPTIKNGKTLANGGGSWMINWECDSILPENQLLGCGKRSILEILWTFFDLEKVKDPS